ncbi:MAG: DUF2298 domain-containing protein [Haloarculaceae archaeon]
MEYGLVAGWWLLYVGLGLLGAPVAARLFSTFESGGPGFALPVASVVLAAVAYWVGHLAFGWVALGAGVAVLVAGAAVSLRRGATVDRRAAAEVLVVFTVAYLLVVGTRALDPALRPEAGNKPLDFGLVLAAFRAARLPPEDFWFAGESLQYYYGGHMLAALFARLSATAPRYAYNLALPGYYAMLVTAAYELGGTLNVARGGTRRVGGLVAAFFVGLASNLMTAGGLAVWAVASVLPGGLRSSVVAAASGAFGVSPDWIRDGPASFNYWRAIHVVPGGNNEFPLFAALHGDLHGHVMSPPFLLLVAGLGLAYYRTPAERRRRRRALAFGAIPVVAGFVATVNSWSLPTALGVTWLALTFAPASPLTLLPTAVTERFSSASVVGAEPGWSPAGEARRIVAATAVTGVVAGISAGWALPFLAGGGPPITVETVAAADRSSALALLVVHGAFFATFAVFLSERLDLGPAPALFGVPALVVAGVVLDPLAGVVLFGPLVAVGWCALRRDSAVGYETVLVVAGAGLLVLVEFVYADDAISAGRFNTVFKTYSQVWALWGTAMGGALPAAVRGTGLDVDRIPALGPDRQRRIRTAFAVGLVLSTGVYGVLTVQNVGAADSTTHALAGGPDRPTLDGLAFVERNHPDEAAALDWLRARAGSPTVASAPALEVTTPPPLDWLSPVSTFGGLPTVLGSENEIGYRGVGPVVERMCAVRAVYTGSTAERAAALRAFDVRYVYVGPVERERYGDPSFADLPVAFENERVTIYRVDRERLPGGTSFRADCEYDPRPSLPP